MKDNFEEIIIFNTSHNKTLTFGIVKCDSSIFVDKEKLIFPEII